MITTFDSDGTGHDRVVSRLDTGGQVYVSANHWPRAWYRRALPHPDVQATIDGKKADYRAVPVTGDEHEHVEHGLGIGFRILTGFPSGCSCGWTRARRSDLPPARCHDLGCALLCIRSSHVCGLRLALCLQQSFRRLHRGRRSVSAAGWASRRLRALTVSVGGCRTALLSMHAPALAERAGRFVVACARGRR